MCPRPDEGVESTAIVRWTVRTTHSAKDQCRFVRGEAVSRCRRLTLRHLVFIWTTSVKARELHMRNSSIGVRLLGIAIGICVAFGIVAGVVVAIVVSPIIFVATAFLLRRAGFNGRRTRSDRVHPEWSRDAAPVIDGEFEVIKEAMPEPGSRSERTVSAERHHVPRATGTPFEERRAAGHGNRFELP